MPFPDNDELYKDLLARERINGMVPIQTSESRRHMLLIDYDEIDFDSVNQGDVICRRHFPYKPMKVYMKLQEGTEEVILLEAVGKGAGFRFRKTKSEFNESNYIRPKLEE